MFVLEISCSLLLLHFRSREHVSTCFHFAFYKADFRLCRDPFPRLPFVINKVFFPFSQLRPCQTDEPRRLRHVLPRRWGRAKPLSFLLQHLCCCHGPAAEQTAAPEPPMPLPRGSGSSPPHRCCWAGEPAMDSSLWQWREAGTWQRDRCK